MKKIFLIPVVLALLFSAPAIMAQPPADTWFGRVTIGGVQQNDTAIVEAFIGGSKVTNVTVGLYTSGYYLIDVLCDPNTQVTLKVNGINASPVQTCQPNDGTRQEFNLTVNKSADGASCTYAAGCSGGFCNSNVCASAAPSTTTTTTTGGGGGGGGGGGAAVAQQTVTVPVVATNTPVTATFSDQTLGVQSIELTSSAAALNAGVTVKESSRPVLAPSPVSATGFVYKYLNITSTLSSVTSAKIKFSITKAWVTANNIDVNTITLSRLVNNVWVKLQTAKISETATLINFEATSPGLSIFVVTGEKVGAPAPAAVCGNEICEAGETTANCRQDCPPAPPAPAPAPTPQPQPPIELPKIEPTPTNIFYAVFILIIFVIGGIWHYRKRPAKQAI